jgi:CheY-like chemotaxis protein
VSATHPNGSGGPVLLVDDDLDIREILPETMADMGFEVVTAANGLEALRMVGQMPVRPSVILLDLMMPVMDGYGFLEARTKEPEIASIPVAIITAGHGIDKARIGDQAPIIRKPFNVPHLVSVLHQLRAGSEG